MLPSYAENRAKSRTLSAEINSAESKINSIESARSQLSGIADTINQLLVSIPADKDEPNLISELEVIGAKHGMAIPAINISGTASDETASNQVLSSIAAGTPVSVSFSVAGSFENISAFTESLEKSIKFMHINSVTMTVQADGNISASYSVDAYTRAQETAVGAGGTE